MNGSDSISKAASTRHIWSYVIITCLFSWSFWLASGVLGRQYSGAYDFRWLIAQVGVFGPSLTALLVSGWMQKGLRANALRTFPFLLLPLIIPGILIAVSAPSGVIEYSPTVTAVAGSVCILVMLYFSSLNRRLLNPGTGDVYQRPGIKWVFLSFTFFPALFLLAWLLVNIPGGSWEITSLHRGAGGFAVILLGAFAHNLLLGGPLGEEIGWRGFLLPKLLQGNSPLAASLKLGVLWALWHLPIDLSAGTSGEVAAAILFRIISALSFSVLFTWFYLHKGNLLAFLILHTVINMLPDLGFSRYESSILLFVVFCAITAMIISASSAVFRHTSGQVHRA